MLFIVTTRYPRELPHGEHPHDYSYSTTIVSRRAVVTLEEAKRRIFGMPEIDVMTVGVLIRQLDALTESGGFVGPLPDGTIIHVEALSPLMLASKCGVSAELVLKCVRSVDYGPLVDAYNEENGV